MATETSSTGRESDKFMLRLPEGMREQLKAVAELHNRTMNAEIVSRLQDSFGFGDAQVKDAELEKLRTENWHFEMVADLADSYRSLTGALLVAALDALPTEQWPAGVNGHVLDILAERDERGAAFSILRLLEGVSPEAVQELRNFASHIEDEGLDNVRTLTKLKEAIAANRVISQAKLRESQEKALEAIRMTMPPPAALSRGPVASKNARRSPPKKR